MKAGTQCESKSPSPLTHMTERRELSLKLSSCITSGECKGGESVLSVLYSGGKWLCTEVCVLGRGVSILAGVCTEGSELGGTFRNIGG